MNISRQGFVNINKYALIAGIIVYLVGIFTPIKTLQIGIIFVLGVGCFNLFHQKYFAGRLKLAAHTWLIPILIGSLTYSIPVQKEPFGSNFTHWLLTIFISGTPLILLLIGKTTRRPSKKPRLRIVNARILVQCILLMVYAVVTSQALITGKRADLVYWAVFHVFTVAILPFLLGRVLCSWICPNATLQDALLKNLNFKRPIEKLPRAIEEQTNTCAMNTSGKVDKTAPLLPATLLLSWFPMFFAETVFDLTQIIWYPVFFMYGLFILSFFFKWRKMCAHFCWLSSYRGLAAHNSIWRIRYNKSECQSCKRCLAERACPFYIDIRNQDNEMPATCSVCFSCMEACPSDKTFTYRRAKKEKERLRA